MKETWKEFISEENSSMAADAILNMQIEMNLYGKTSTYCKFT